MSELRKRESRVPVVVVEGSLNGLGVVRSLSHGRMPIYVVDTSRFCAAGWSRLCTFVRVPSLEGPQLIDSLVELGSKLKSRPVLILTGDGCVDAVSSNRQKIQSLFRISLPSEETLQALADKSRFQELARRQGFDIPRGASLEGTEDLKRLEDLRLPLILKPANKKLVLAKSVERAVRAMTLSEAKSAAMRMLANAPEIIVQEWVDGPDSEIFFSLFSCDGDGNIVGIFTGRKVVCSPPGIGNTAICIAAPEEAAELQALVSRFVATVGYRGLGSIEFKRDRKTRRFVMI